MSDWKRILCAVDGSGDSLSALRHGAEIALRSGGEVRALFVKDARLLDSTAVSKCAGAAGQIEEALAREAEGALGRARDVCGRLGQRIATDVRRGVVPMVLVEEAKDVDLLTMGRWGEHVEWAGGLLGSAVEAVVRKVKRPILVASGAYAPTRRLVVAFDGSPLAEHAKALATRIGSLLGLPVEVFEAPAHNAAVEIAGESTPESMLFLGAYGHSPLRELVLGSVTEQVMRRAKGPVVLCR